MVDGDVNMIQNMRDELRSLTTCSRNTIEKLTEYGKSCEGSAEDYVMAIHERFFKVDKKERLPHLYLIDSLIKSYEASYLAVASTYIPEMFLSIFQTGDAKLRVALFKLFITWIDMVDNNLMQELNESISLIDQNWPLTDIKSFDRTVEYEYRPKSTRNRVDNTSCSKKDSTNVRKRYRTNEAFLDDAGERFVRDPRTMPDPRCHASRDCEYEENPARRMSKNRETIKQVDNSDYQQDLESENQNDQRGRNEASVTGSNTTNSKPVDPRVHPSYSNDYRKMLESERLTNKQQDEFYNYEQPKSSRHGKLKKLSNDNVDESLEIQNSMFDHRRQDDIDDSFRNSERHTDRSNYNDSYSRGPIRFDVSDNLDDGHGDVNKYRNRNHVTGTDKGLLDSSSRLGVNHSEYNDRGDKPSYRNNDFSVGDHLKRSEGSNYQRHNNWRDNSNHHATPYDGDNGDRKFDRRYVYGSGRFDRDNSRGGYNGRRRRGLYRRGYQERDNVDYNFHRDSKEDSFRPDSNYYENNDLDKSYYNDDEDYEETSYYQHGRTRNNDRRGNYHESVDIREVSPYLYNGNDSREKRYPRKSIRYGRNNYRYGDRSREHKRRTSSSSHDNYDYSDRNDYYSYRNNRSDGRKYHDREDRQYYDQYEDLDSNLRQQDGVQVTTEDLQYVATAGNSAERITYKGYEQKVGLVSNAVTDDYNVQKLEQLPTVSDNINDVDSSLLNTKEPQHDRNEKEMQLSNIIKDECQLSVEDSSLNLKVKPNFDVTDVVQPAQIVGQSLVTEEPDMPIMENALEFCSNQQTFSDLQRSGNFQEYTTNNGDEPVITVENRQNFANPVSYVNDRVGHSESFQRPPLPQQHRYPPFRMPNDMEYAVDSQYSDFNGSRAPHMDYNMQGMRPPPQFRDFPYERGRNWRPSNRFERPYMHPRGYEDNRWENPVRRGGPDIHYRPRDVSMPVPVMPYRQMESGFRPPHNLEPVYVEHSPIRYPYGNEGKNIPPRYEDPQFMPNRMVERFPQELGKRNEEVSVPVQIANKPMESQVETTGKQSIMVKKLKDMVSDLTKKIPVKNNMTIAITNDSKDVISLSKSFIKIYHPDIIKQLLKGRMCANCSQRFEMGDKRYPLHLDWHFNEKRNIAQNKNKGRLWFKNTDQDEGSGRESWLFWKDISKNVIENTKTSMMEIFAQNIGLNDKLQLSHAAGKITFSGDPEIEGKNTKPSCMAMVELSNDHKCPSCQEKFDQFWHEELEEWHYENAVRVDKIAYHVTCNPENSSSQTKDVKDVKGELQDYSNLEYEKKPLV